MNYQAFTNDSLIMMDEGIRAALESDDELVALGEQPRFRVRETPDWKQHAADLEHEMSGVNDFRSHRLGAMGRSS